MRGLQIRRGSIAGAFTLIEIMVVLVIIAILITISVVVASKVTQGGKVRATEDLIRVLDNALTSYMAETEGKVPAVYWDEADPPRPFPVWDGRYTPTPGSTSPDNVDRDLDPAEPSQAVFMLMARQVPAVEAILKGIDARHIQRLTQVRVGIHNQPAQKRATSNTTVDAESFYIKDAWGRPIRFVHPAWDGGGGPYWDGANMVARDPIEFDYGTNGSPPRQGPDGNRQTLERLRRSYKPRDPASAPPAPRTTIVGDADEGLCIADRPYFYSAGPDGDPGTRGDNVYTTRPTFPTETAKFE